MCVCFLACVLQGCFFELQVGSTGNLTHSLIKRLLFIQAVVLDAPRSGRAIMGWFENALEVIPSNLTSFIGDKARAFTPGIAGILFGIGWAVWADAVAVSPVKTPFVQARFDRLRWAAARRRPTAAPPIPLNAVSPGHRRHASAADDLRHPQASASLPLTATHAPTHPPTHPSHPPKPPSSPPLREEVASYDPFDEEVYCRSRAWLLSAYLVSFGAIIGSVVVMMRHYSLPEEGEQRISHLPHPCIECVLWGHHWHTTVIMPRHYWLPERKVKVRPSPPPPKPTHTPFPPGA